MAKTYASEVLKQRTHSEASKESMLLTLAGGKAAMPWQTVTRAGD